MSKIYEREKKIRFFSMSEVVFWKWKTYYNLIILTDSKIQFKILGAAKLTF